MANLPVPEKPVYDPTIPEFDITAPVHADTAFNAVNKKHLENIHYLKLKADNMETLKGETDPTEDTKGAVAQKYLNTKTTKEYICVEITEDGKYKWQQSGASDASDLSYDGKPLSDTLDDIKILIGGTDPDEDTQGAAGQKYFNETSGKEFICNGIEDGKYIWKQSGASDAADLTYKGESLKEFLDDIPLDIFIIQSGTPAGDKKKLWINSSNGVAHYWSGSAWIPIKGAAG